MFSCWTKIREILGINGLVSLREDLLLVSLSLTRITMLHHKGSTNIIMSGSDSTVELLERGLPFLEDAYLRSFYGEPWCFLTMCATTMLLKIYLGKESWQTGKSSYARMFLDLHYKYIGIYKTSLSNQQNPAYQNSQGQLLVLEPMEFPASACSCYCCEIDWC